MIWDILQQSTFNQYFQSPSIETLTIQTLLLDENIITEFKNMNPQLIEYVEKNRDQFISKLIGYTVVLPNHNDSEERIKNLPYVSSQLLAIDNQIIYQSLLENQKGYFTHLMKIFDTEACENQILMGYFLKIVQNLYKCQKKKASSKIYQFCETFYKHLDNQSVGSIFKMFLILLETQQGYMLNERKQVLRKLIDYLVEEKQSVKAICSGILVEVIFKFQTFSSGDELKDQIVNSQKLVKIFQINDSEAVDQFMIGYLTKALQKICTAGDEKKSLLQIPIKHKQRIPKLIILKKNLLKVQNNQINSFTNQSQQKVHRFSKQLIRYLTIIKLALQNNVIGFFNQDDIISLFSLLQRHPTNDIIKVKIFNIFGFIFTKKDQVAQHAFMKVYYKKMIDLFEMDKRMFGYFIYQLWKLINKKNNSSPDLVEQDMQKWNDLLKYFEINENYEKQTQKVIDRYSNRTKVVKLVVDEEDNTSSVTTVSTQRLSQKTSAQRSLPKVQPIQQAPKIVENISKQEGKKQSAKKDSFSFDMFTTVFPASEKSQKKVEATKIKTDPFAAFTFATSTVKKQDKKADFSDFGSFF